MDNDFKKIREEKEIELKNNQNEIDEGLIKIKEYFKQKKLIFANIFEEIDKEINNLIYFINDISKDIYIKKYKFNEKDFSDFDEFGMFVVEFKANITLLGDILPDGQYNKKEIHFIITIYDEGYGLLSGEKLIKDSVVMKLIQDTYVKKKEKINNYNNFLNESFRHMLNVFKNNNIKILPK
jgi:hypothetical protein